MLVDEGALAGDAGVWSATRDLDELAIPATINALLSARLDRLDADEREAIQCAAVVGKEFWWGSVADLVDPELCDDVATRLHALVRKRLIVPAGSAVIVGEDAFRFSHILVRDAAYGALPKSRRADLHERHADWLLAKSEGRATQMEEIVGYHLEQAYRTRVELGPADAAAAELAGRAAKHLAASGRRALERGDSHAAARLLRRASALGENAAAEVAPELGTALMQSGALREAEDVLSRAVEAASRTGDARRAAHAAVVRGDVHLRTHPTWALEETRTVGEQAIETFARVEDDRGLAVALRLLSFTHAWHCEWQAMTEALERALLHADRTRDLLLRATIVTSLNVSLYYGPTPVDEVIRRYETVLDSVEDESVASGETSCLLAGALAMSGRPDEARAFASRGTMILAELGQRVRLGIARAYVADAELLAGDARAAEHELVEAYATLDGIGNKSGAFSAAWELASILCGQGRYDEADRWAAPGRDVLEESDVMTRVTGLADGSTTRGARGSNGTRRDALRGEPSRSRTAPTRSTCAPEPGSRSRRLCGSRGRKPRRTTPCGLPSRSTSRRATLPPPVPRVRQERRPRRRRSRAARPSPARAPRAPARRRASSSARSRPTQARRARWSRSRGPHTA